MSKFFKTTLFFISVLFLTSCSSDDNSSSTSDDDGGQVPPPQTFTLKEQTFRLNEGIIQSMDDSETGITTTSVAIAGLNGLTLGTVSFTVFYNTADGIDGTYTSDEDINFETAPRIYSSTFSQYFIMQGEETFESNQAVGPVKITSHGNNEYTLEFDVEFGDGVKASGNVKKTFTVQA